jgi:tRNA (adenine22-N1)-methyltransferase
MVPSCDCVVDVGTDHAQLPLALLQHGVVRRAIGVDKSEMPLAQARVNRMNAGCRDSLELRCADGLDGLTLSSTDVVVMAGMGAQTMMQVLQATDWRGTVVLQPNRDVPRLRRWLSTNGWTPEMETLIEARGQWFWTSRWFYLGSEQCLSENDLDFGVGVLEQSPDFFQQWAAQEIARLHRLPPQAEARLNIRRLEGLLSGL